MDMDAQPILFIATLAHLNLAHDKRAAETRQKTRQHGFMRSSHQSVRPFLRVVPVGTGAQGRCGHRRRRRRYFVTVVAADAVLLLRFGSGVALVTAAWLTIGPRLACALTLTPMLLATVPPFASGSTVHVIVAPSVPGGGLLQVHPLAVTAWKLVPYGSGSVMVTDRAASGPAFETLIA